LAGLPWDEYVALRLSRFNLERNWRLSRSYGSHT
jgi:hypothetical protein